MNWLPLFSNPDIAGILFASLKFLQNHQRLTIYAYVLMENHIHLVASSEQLARELGNFKSYTARRWIDYYQAHGNHYILDQLALNKPAGRKDQRYQFWQEGVGPRRIQDREMMHHQMMSQKITYMHHNQVTRGYVDEPEHWRYSSARNYAGVPGMLEVCMEW